ncbi:MAG: 2Fe-2S iron-sulfur cluster binding domain-containing protein [Burkholderiales bacterium]|nr:2Fe-2S iron-sulfur cluster binding domain-containing protein [Burkholderiales bacterium]
MGRAFSDIVFTPAVRAVQTRMGSRSVYAPLDRATDRRDTLTADEIAFIQERDGFYQATVGESGWPYVQFRGGPAGFLHALDAKTLAYADFRGNVQYISVGNLAGNDRVSLFLMDYANQRRLKILGRVRLVDARDDARLIAGLTMPGYPARIKRAMVITVEGYDWNCPQHITPRFTRDEIEAGIAPLRDEIARLNKALASPDRASVPERLGQGPLALRVAGIRQLTPRVRAYELRAADGTELPPVTAGSHIDVPVRLTNGTTSTRRYSIASNPRRRDAYEIAVLREEQGTGGSTALHANVQLGSTLHCGLPGNDFALHDDDRPAMLIAGGIGITPIKAMAEQLRSGGRSVDLHYAVRSLGDAPYLQTLRSKLGAELRVYAADQQQRLDMPALIAHAVPGTVFYVCGPARLIDAAQDAARAAGVPADRVRTERFAAPTPAAANRPLVVTLRRSGRRIAVAADQTILDAVEAAGVPAPSGCRAGDCGTCQVKVVQGQPEHRDSALSDAERDASGLMCICVSRALSPELTLDL